VKRHGILATAGALLGSLALASSVLAAGAFQNGGFESGNYQGPTYGFDFDRVFAGTARASDITGWTVTVGSVDWIGSYWQAAEGTKSIDLDGDEGTPGAMSQTFATSVNATYVVSYALSGNPDAGPANKTMTIDVGGAKTNVSYDTSAYGTTRADMKYVTKGYSFVATSTTTTLTFTSTTPGGYGPVIDNIVITETLATGAQCKNGGWQSMVDKYSTPFKNQGDCVSYYATGERNLAN
jgi:choice-of-anchor C domain-containing protein